jgi:hypothetical protein
MPVLVMTAVEDEEEIRQEFQQAGASEVLGNGTTYEEILAAVRRLGDEG